MYAQVADPRSILIINYLSDWGLSKRLVMVVGCKMALASALDSADSAAEGTSE